MKIEETEENLKLVKTMESKLDHLGYSLDCSTEAEIDFSLYARALHYALHGRGALFTCGTAVSSTNFFGGVPLEFRSKLEMRKVLRSSGWCLVSVDTWKPRLVSAE